MSTPSQREIVQSLVYKHRLETESAYVVATRLIEGAEEFKAALTLPPEKDAFTLKDRELNSLVNLAVDLTSGFATQETGMEFAQVLSSIEARLAAIHEIAKEIRNAIPTQDGAILAAMIEQGVTVLGSHIEHAVSSMHQPKE
jgi:hypothetical protein